MTLYLLAGILTALVVAVLLHPLLRRREEGEAAGAEELEVYKAQLTDIDRDLAAGTLAAEEAGLARREVERRILAADEARRRRVVQGAPARRLALVLLVVLPLAGPGLYLLLGQPDLPAQPHGEREDVAMQRAVQQRAEELRRSLAQSPADPEGWQELAMLRSLLGQAGAAAEAYRLAIANGADEAEVHAALAEALIMQAAGEVTPEARGALADSLARDGNQPLALYYIGHALEQEGRNAMALQLWSDMAAALPEGTQWRRRLDRDILRLRAKMDAQGE